MLDEVGKKIRGRTFRGSVVTRCVSFGQLGSLRGTMFDGAYSNMGGLNCTEDLAQVAADLAALVRGGGFLIATVMPSFCLWETAAFLGRLHWRDAFRRRMPGGVAARLHGGTVQTYYHSPGAFRRAFAPYFEHVLTTGLPVFLPPPNFVRTYARLGRLAGVLARLDDAAAGMPILRSIGDHYSMVLRRKGG